MSWIDTYDEANWAFDKYLLAYIHFHVIGIMTTTKTNSRFLNLVVIDGRGDRICNELIFHRELE